MPALLDVHSYYSFGAGTSGPAALARRARRLGYGALALTDDLGVYGAVAHLRACRAAGIRPLVGATLPLELEGEPYPLVLIALDRGGYRNLNELLTIAHLGAGWRDGGRGSAAEGGTGRVAVEQLARHAAGIACLSGPRRGFPARLLAARRYRALEARLGELAGIFGDRFYVQLFHDRHPWDDRRVRGLRRVARALGLPCVAAPEVRMADASLYPLLDALACARLGIDVATPHPERPRNDAGVLLPPEELERRVPFPEALANTDRLAARSRLELLGGRLEPPRAELPLGVEPDAHLAALCHARLREVYPAARLTEARAVLERELHVLERYGFAEFFLVAAEIADFCRARGILAAGRGSAAGSVVCHLLGITRADPIEHGLLFERFLHTGMTSFPDVDIDIASSRRAEVLAWIETRFGADGEAMVCNRITYRLPLAVQDLGRALGIPPAQRGRLTRALGRDGRSLPPHRAREAALCFDEVLRGAPVQEVLLGLLERLEPGTVRHIAPHAGGVVLARTPLPDVSPLQRSSGGIRLLQFDKDDVEALGLIKLDLLGLRMLGALERAREEVARVAGVWLDLDALPDDPAVWERVAAGDTLALFQIESPSQMRTSVEMRPRTLRDLAHQIALIRPGPIQSGTVHPYLRRRRGEEATSYPHPALEPILAETYGVILFQEQILRVARRVAGMSWQEADRFRRRVSSFGEPADLEPDRRRFVEGVVATVGATREQAEAIFEAVKAFQGFGFAESHAWAFALHAYASLWLRHHWPAEYLAAFLTEAPGMWPVGTVRQEARRLGVRWLPVDVNASAARAYRVERSEAAGHGAPDGADAKALRPPLAAIDGVSADAARAAVLERLARGPFGSLADLYRRLGLPYAALEALVRAGACDRLAGPGARRRLLFELAALRSAHPPGRGGLFDDAAPPAPPLPPLTVAERAGWDVGLRGASELELHPLDLMRRQLLDLGAEPLAAVARRAPADGAPGDAPRVRTAGLVVARQKPPTAKGFAFYMLEDGPLRAQLIIPPALWDARRATLRDAAVLLVEADATRAGVNLSLRAQRLWGLAAVAGTARPPARSFR